MDVTMKKDDLVRIITFTPPLYKQRYAFIKQLVDKHKPKKVADLGCADCSLLWMLKFCNCIEELVGLDISEEVMKENMYKLSPLPGDYLQPSEKQLTVTLLQGSVAHKDPCMLGFDMVTCIELIEHLEAKELEKFPEVVFGFMSPAMIIISTPNSEFNCLLPIVSLFRHPDHKFEWNRTQFQNWAVDVAARYDYTVEFTGVGAPPHGKDVGFCTQIGVFVRKNLRNVKPERFEEYQRRVYKTVFKVIYPSLKDEKYLQNAVVNEVFRAAEIIARKQLDYRKSECKKQCSSLIGTESQFQQSSFQMYMDDFPFSEADSKIMQPTAGGNIIYVPLGKIFSFSKVNQLCGTFEKLSKLITGKIPLSHDGSAVMIEMECEDEQQNDDNN
ncbi:small RNA 2'-O-methyltransferase [Crotalus tigris]|uniref:small RNA 2'-O-methyltransferase n=1 Tax=Crotalus tigris TaxID=88082 RepID=UPI00192FB2BB|nr:small RNA 2'-O-methyltransferase [Crotalus tigris]XP_039185573.1 small RNA 2'-O-methyltransferase [Crotalus tigris]XP_039185574.1 small RNA 2'-O-methyltransferase [Crotalus tigris]XP_039185575.1 small RNA 2'-O-methyltransferase [Crotalus tigris]XP_039185576.1 small RNA 2'-O-methyltransferase [Crotalus tigris]